MAVLTGTARAALLLATAAFAADPAVVLRRVAIFDPGSGRMLADRTIVIEGERITAVGTLEAPVRAPRGARVIDGRGRYVLPGLIDAHVHLIHQPDFAHMTPEELLPMYLAWGVTGLRDIGDEIVAEKMAQRYADAHPDICPRIFLGSPLLDGDPPFHSDIGRAVTDPEKVPDLVTDLKAWGVTTLKIYVRTDRPVGRRIIDEGHRQGLVVASHLGKYKAQDAVPDGLDVLEHIWSVINYSFPEGGEKPARGAIDLNNPNAVALRELIVRHKTMVDPTLAVFRNMILLNDLPEVHNNPDNAPTPRRLREHWDRFRRKSNLQPSTRETRLAEFRKYQELTGLLYKAGVPLLAGTDAPEPYVPPGASLHQELEMLVESGLTPAAALTAATLNNARALRQEANLGSIGPGKLADLVLLTANPLDDIRNTRKIALVVRGGRMVDPKQAFAALPKE